MHRVKRFVILSGIILLLITPLPIYAQEELEFVNGDRVIVLPDIVPVRLSPSVSASIVTELWGGMVTRVVTIETNTAGETWLYLENYAFGWVPTIQDGKPTLSHFSDTVLDEMVMNTTNTINNEPTDIEAYLRRGTVYLVRREFSLAISDYSKAIELDPEEGRLYEYRGKAYLDSHAFAEAVVDFEKASTQLEYIQEEKVLPGLFNRLGLAYLEQTELVLAFHNFSIAIEIEPKWGLLHSNMGNVFSRWELYDDALTHYNKAVSLDPHFASAYRNRGLLYEDLDQNESALEDYNRAIEIDPYYVDAYVQRGIWYEEVARDYETASENFEEALSINPESSRAYTARAVLRRAMGYFEEALGDFKSAIQYDPFNLYPYYNLASLYSQLGQYQEALETYHQVTELGNRFDLGLLLYRAQVYVALNDYESALTDLKQYLSVDLRNDFSTTAHLVRGSIYLHQKRYDEASEEYSAAFSIWKDFAQDFEYYGMGYLITPQRANLIFELQSQIEVTPSSPELHIQLGNMYMEFGQWQEGINSYQSALELGANIELAAFVFQLQTLIE
jgi:tetratricopeptide (TPR) repeat protein